MNRSTWNAYIHNGIVFDHEKIGTLRFMTTRMNLEAIMVCKISQTKLKERDTLHGITSMWNLKLKNAKQAMDSF